jgi:hypothetical protein
MERFFGRISRSLYSSAPRAPCSAQVSTGNADPGTVSPSPRGIPGGVHVPASRATGPAARVAVCSLFRNCAHTVDYYRALLDSQPRAHLGITCSFVEGDSTDDTWAKLCAWRDGDPRVTLVQRNVEPVRDFQDRVLKWAELGNAALEGALATDCTHVLWCESDLTLPHDLLEQLVACDVDVVAPAIFLGGMFYDTWGFRGLDGKRFANVPPYHAEWLPHELVELSSVGSVVLFRREVFDKGVGFRGVYPDGLLAGVCADARQAGFRVWMDSRVAVLHPTTSWRKAQYALERVEVECADASLAAEWNDVAREIENEVDVLLGSVELDGDHPVFAPVRAIVARRMPGRPHKIGVRLASEARKRYALVLEDGGQLKTADGAR